jgi:1-pyrroline-5-carboxylate dehydrogenase
MSNARFNVPTPINEPVKSYAPGTPERAELKAKIAELKSTQIEIPLVIGGEEIRTGKTKDDVIPHEHAHVLAKVHQGDGKSVEQAIAASQEAWHDWSNTPWEHRAAVLLKAADLLAGPWRSTINAATMLCQSKTAHQAEIDSAAELIDFFRFNAAYMADIYADQPISSPGCWNRVEHRPLEGFVFAVTPFNFTSIAGNLPTSPALMGCVSLWKPASSTVFSNWFVMKLLMEAGMPPGVINFVPGSGGTIGDPAIAHPLFAGVHFTGSTGVFRNMWKTIGENIGNYRSYPRIVGETGGKDFVFVHPSAHVEAVVANLVRGSFEFQGQKCSAASRAYIPESLWPQIKDQLVANVKSLTMGSPTDDFRNFMGAVIDAGAFKDITGYIDYAKSASDADILVGGEYDDSEGYFVQPTVIHTTNPTFKTMVEEIFGPVLTVFVYPDNDLEGALKNCDTASPYALTGAIFAQDRLAAVRCADALRHTAGNFYINDKPTGAVVGQQPFGGSRASGTNDKAGSKLNLSRWVSQRTIKETFVPATDWRYPFLGEK